jgi:hypothetical protein
MTEQPQTVDISAPAMRSELVRLRELEQQRDAALERVRELTEWRPMETAPRDGTAILLVESFGESRVIARWVDETWASVCAYSGTFYTDDDDFYHGWLPLPPTP